MSDENKKPTVKLTPDFKVGESVTHKETGVKLKILSIDLKRGTARVDFSVCPMPLSVLEKL